ncbi:MAG: TRAP transporter substrate-binding protein [Gammaproteobacteria bacterium]|nr:TRAP transporter substrate-binding protein [Gammaproteobacteria bacterium]MDH5304809.1 TRAP transporter substrate-binding protein [Gammaproteobacteria bacterium]MDH5322682.1 TRAP transporter substrate-binding protein [Gammaproteobacteria bacterium]
MKRRHFVGGLAAAASVAACSDPAKDCSGPDRRAAEQFEWSCVTSWPPKLPGMGMGVENLASRINAASGGRLRIKVYGGGELVPAFEVFDAVSRGTVEMGHDASYYHKGKLDAAQFFTTIPFGMNYLELNGWLYYGGGIDLWRELYAPFNLVPIPCGNTGVQMGGWFNREINSAADLVGLKMRIPGLAGEVLRRAGGTPVTLPGAEIFTSLQTGAIDATEWVGAYNDVSFGLHKAAKYYYYPGWHEPGPGLETMINKTAWDSLPADLQAIVETTCQAITTDMVAEYTHGNTYALQQLLDDPEVEVRSFPREVMDLLKSITADIVAEWVEKDPAAKKIADSYYAFLDKSAYTQRVTEQAYLDTRT